MPSPKPTDLSVEVVDIATLTPDPENARKHSQRNLKAISNSLSKFGQRRPVVVAAGTGGENVVIAGNGTVEAAKILGWTKIAITRVPKSWSHDKARAYALADNRTAELAEWDADILATQLVDLDSMGWEVSDFGFEPLTPPVDPYSEWDNLPDYIQDDNHGVFQVTIHFPTDRDAEAFFALIERPKKKTMWWPDTDGHVGQPKDVRWVTEG